MTYLMRKPLLAMGVQVKVKVEDHFAGKKVSADLGPLSQWVCIQDHESGNRPPAGFGDVVGTGVPHVHTPEGLIPLDDGVWVVVYDRKAHVMQDIDVKIMFDEVDAEFLPTWMEKDEWRRYNYPKVRGDATEVRMARKSLEAGKDALSDGGKK